MDELTYDKSHLNYKRIYRLESHFTINGKDDLFAVTQIPLGPTLKDEYPEIEEYVRFAPTGTLFLKYRRKGIPGRQHCILLIPLFSGYLPILLSREIQPRMLNRPYTLVMTESLAEKYFGDENPVGKTIKSVEGNLYEVTGVIKDLPGNLHLRFDGIAFCGHCPPGSWVANDSMTAVQVLSGISASIHYIMLKEGADIEADTGKVPRLSMINT